MVHMTTALAAAVLAAAPCIAQYVDWDRYARRGYDDAASEALYGRDFDDDLYAVRQFDDNMMAGRDLDYGYSDDLTAREYRNGLEQLSTRELVGHLIDALEARNVDELNEEQAALGLDEAGMQNDLGGSGADGMTDMADPSMAGPGQATPAAKEALQPEMEQPLDETEQALETTGHSQSKNRKGHDTEHASSKRGRKGQESDRDDREEIKKERKERKERKRKERERKRKGMSKEDRKKGWEHKNKKKGREQKNRKRRDD